MEISYPVFRLGNYPPICSGQVILYMYERGDASTYYRIVDDKSIEETSLARRRLQMAKEGIPLKKISRALFFLGDLIKIARPSTWFIDANGNLFQYKKSIRVKLEFRKITKVIRIKTGGALLEVEGVPGRLKLMYSPKYLEKYAGVLRHGLSYILYGVYTEQYDTTWRMV